MKNKGKHSRGYYSLLVVLGIIITVFIYNLICNVFCGRLLLKPDNEVFYTYGRVYYISEGTGRFSGSNSIDTHVIIGKKKYNVCTLEYNVKPFRVGGFYKVVFWCKHTSCARIYWTSQPIDTAIVNEYFRKNNIDFYGTSFNKDVLLANNGYGRIFFIGIIKDLFRKKDKEKCVCCE